MMFEYFALIVTVDIVMNSTLAHVDSEAPRLNTHTLIVVEIYYHEVTTDYMVILHYATITDIVIDTTDDGYIYLYFTAISYFVHE